MLEKEDTAGCRQILRHLGCHALGAGLGLVCSEETSQALKQRTVRTYGQACLGSVKGKLEQRDWGGEGYGGVTEMHARGGMTQDNKEELKEVNWQTR